MSFTLFNYSSLSYIILALPSVVTNLPNNTLIFNDFQGPKIKFHDFPGLENEILKFHGLPGFPWPVRANPTLSSVKKLGQISLQMNNLRDQAF